jgi:hypothetical protein
MCLRVKVIVFNATFNNISVTLWQIVLLIGETRETGNIGYTRHKAKTNNPEKLATLGTQDIRRKQATQRNWQHWVHKT